MEVVEDDSNFVQIPPSIVVCSDESNDLQECDSDGPSRPVTPPNDHASLKLNKSLGLVLSPQSPPCRKIRSMKLIESPRLFKARLELPFTSTPTSSPCVGVNFTPKGNKSTARRYVRARAVSSSHSFPLSQTISSPSDVINPFTPPAERSIITAPRSTSKRPNKRTTPKCVLFHGPVPCENEGVTENRVTTEKDESMNKRSRPRLSDFNFPRYQQEFLELGTIGAGDHGCVFRCLNIVNGSEYAIKKILKPAANERIARNEIYAHAVLQHPNIVLNHSNWTEEGHVFMQNEYCNGGSLDEEIRKEPLDEKHLRRVLEHISQGLWYMHSKQLAHMDIKPGNIFIRRGPRLLCKSFDHDDLSEDEENDTETVYKIGDLGHVINLDDKIGVIEGDCRYLPKEILRDDYSKLTKADIFALGLTLYEAAGSGPLPKNGAEWHSIRDGKTKPFPTLSHDLNSLIKRMIHPNPDHRPSASDIISQVTFPPIYKSVKEKHELKASKQKIHVLEQRLQNAMKCVQHLTYSDGKRHNALITNDGETGATHNNNKGEEPVEPVNFGCVMRRRNLRNTKERMEKL